MKLALLLFALAVPPQDATTWSELDRARLRTHTPLPPPAPNPTNAVADDERAARLGQKLFFDQRLSQNGELSCASCHDPALGFGDGKQVFEGLARGSRNSPGLWNVAQQRWFFWDGRTDSLWAQAAQPLESAIEMGGDRAHVARVIAGDPELRASYEQIFGALPDLSRIPEHARPVADDPAHPHQVAWQALGEADRRALSRVLANFGKAIEAYERKLVRDDAPFDRFVAALDANDATAADAALSESARRGLRLFLGKGKCRLCHGGPRFSDGEFHNIGVPPLGGGQPTDAARYDGVARVKSDPFNAASEFSDARDGEHALQLATLVQSPQAWGEYRTPSLRNVAITGPYMHQGQFATLRDVLRFYSTLEGATQVGHHQEQVLKPLQLTDSEIDDLVAFLEALTGAEPRTEWVAAPAER